MDVINIPSFLDEGTLHFWEVKAINILDSFSYGSLSDLMEANRKKKKSEDEGEKKSLVIEFSDEEPKAHQGFLSSEIAKAILKKRWPNLPEDRMEYLSLQGSKESIIVGLRDILPPVVGMPRKEVEAELKRLLPEGIYCKKESNVYVLGEYLYPEKRIVLYNKAIERSKEESKTMEQCYEEVFAHEFFHALHYVLSGNSEEMSNRKDYTAKVVKEALAAWFEAYY